jgi:hypothetical protein
MTKLHKRATRSKGGNHSQRRGIPLEESLEESQVEIRDEDGTPIEDDPRYANAVPQLSQVPKEFLLNLLIQYEDKIRNLENHIGAQDSIIVDKDNQLQEKSKELSFVDKLEVSRQLMRECVDELREATKLGEKIQLQETNKRRLELMDDLLLRTPRQDEPSIQLKAPVKKKHSWLHKLIFGVDKEVKPKEVETPPVEEEKVEDRVELPTEEIKEEEVKEEEVSGEAKDSPRAEPILAKEGPSPIGSLAKIGRKIQGSIPLAETDESQQ